MWALHYYLKKEYVFNDSIPVFNQINSVIIFFISLSIFLASMAKSAIFPFTTWLPRAMEGPTPSSAISYGALSVHVGILLLIKTQEIWQHSVYFKTILFIFGITTAILSNLISLVQSNIKGQIAYATASQIGIMLIELRDRKSTRLNSSH